MAKLNMKIRPAVYNGTIKQTKTRRSWLDCLDMDVAWRICQRETLAAVRTLSKRRDTRETRKLAHLTSSMNSDFYLPDCESARARRIHRRLKHVQLLGQLPAESICVRADKKRLVGSPRSSLSSFYAPGTIIRPDEAATGNVVSVANEPVRQRREP